MHVQSVSSRTDGRLTFYKEFLYYFSFFRYCVKHPLWHCDWVKLSKRIFLIKPSYMCFWWSSFIRNYIFKTLFKLNKDTIWCTKIVHLLCKKRLICHYQSPQILCTIYDMTPPSKYQLIFKDWANLPQITFFNYVYTTAVLQIWNVKSTVALLFKTWLPLLFVQ